MRALGGRAPTGGKTVASRAAASTAPELFVRMEGVTSPEAAKRFSGRLLAVAQEDALPAPEGHFYPWEMAGAVVETRDGRRVGEFVGVDDHTAQPPVDRGRRGS